MGHEQGLTVIELAVVLSIIAIIAAFSLPSLNAWMPRFHFNGQISSLQNHLQLTRYKAINRNTPHTFIFTLSNTTEDSYIVQYQDASGILRTDGEIRGSIGKDVNIAYVDDGSKNSGVVRKIFYPDGSASAGNTADDWSNVFIES